MEMESAIALMTSSQHIVISGSQRQSNPNLPRLPDFPLIYSRFNETEDVPQNDTAPETSTSRSHNQKEHFTWEALSVITSALYCKLLVVLGLALPITEIITTVIPPAFYDVQLSWIFKLFYIYLYGGSLVFILSIHLIVIKNKALQKFKRSSNRLKESSHKQYDSSNHGSFYLQLGACGFGIGSMVYSGLEFGEHFIENGRYCKSSPFAIAKPALRMIFTMIQIHFIFLSERTLHKVKCSGLMRMSLGHMLATNLAEWLAVVIEETKHEIHHLNPSHSLHYNNLTNFSCDGSNSGVLITGATSYLFPCTIEYSLICAVTLVEMWKEIKIDKKSVKERVILKEIPLQKETRQYSVDCTHSEKGLSSGLVSTVYTLISLIVFFSLWTTQKEAAYWCLTICEAVLYSSSILAMIIAAYQMRNLAYCIHRFNSKGTLKLGLDISILLKAQFGSYVYYTFSAIACFFTPGVYVWPDVFALVQTTCQTIFIIDTWWKRCATPKDQENKPGRQCLTFLRLVNVSMWIITVTEKNRAELKPLQLSFYGMWPWTIITHASMPLNVFYRFHSSICFFEIWKTSYKGIHVVPNEEILF